MTDLDVRETAQAAEFTVRVQPGASREGLSLVDGLIKVRVTAPPVEGKANARVLQVLASALDVRRSQVEIMRGSTSRVKSIRIYGMPACELKRRLEQLVKASSGS